MTRFSWLDYSIFVVYLAGAVSVGLLFVKEQRTIKDYFLASRSMGSLLIGVSVLAALFSGISYLGCPSEVYAHRATFVLFGLSFIIATPVTTRLFIPHFYQSRFYTAYHYLEERFSVQVRLLASSLFILRVLLWLALVTYAPALALEQVTGLPLWFSIICTGALTTIYTTLGGMKAVIWTDVIQFVVLFGGQIIILCVAIARIPDGLAGVYHIGQSAGKLDLSLSLDPSVRVTLWGLLLGGAVINLVQLATDQVSVQRYLTATSLKEAQRALWLKFWLLIPVFIVFYLSGLVLYAFYQIHGDPLAAGRITKPDQILPFFVITELPAGLPGLLIAAIYSGTMSATSSGINALTTATLVDFRQRLSRKPLATEAKQLRLARYLTIAYGALVIVLAFGVSKLGPLIEASNKAIGLVGGPLLGLFFLGMLIRKARPWGAVIGWAAGIAAVIPICFSGSPTLSVGDLRDPPAFAVKLNQPVDALSAYVRSRLSDATRDALAEWPSSGPVSEAMRAPLIQDLNTIILGTSIGDRERFTGVTLRPRTKELLSEKPRGEDLARLNRLLLEDAYPRELSRTHETSFLWYGVVGCLVTLVVGWLASLIISLLRPAPVAAATFQQSRREAVTPGR